MNLLLGDNKIHLANMSDSSIDAVVTDPPYGLSFMGKKWDYDVPSVELWREVLRVLKPGGHVLSFGGTRTYHRMVVNMEDAGFEIRDQIQWIYGSGFPKSLDVSKAIDKAAGAERESTPTISMQRKGEVGEISKNKRCAVCGKARASGNPCVCPRLENIAITDLAKQWSGWGTALKPANEPIVLARKPLIGTVAENVQTFGTGALNIDASRIATSADDAKAMERANSPNSGRNKIHAATESSMGRPTISGAMDTTQGRWPANVLFDEDAAAMLDEQSGILHPAGNKKASKTKGDSSFGIGVGDFEHHRGIVGDKAGGASRFFYVAKASKRERGEGNNHPTVKPVKLMEYLVKMVTPPGGIVLDPFMGSGTTGVACRKLGFLFVGCESNAEYYDLAKKRIEHQQEVAS